MELHVIEPIQELPPLVLQNHDLDIPEYRDGLFKNITESLSVSYLIIIVLYLCGIAKFHLMCTMILECWFLFLVFKGLSVILNRLGDLMNSY